MSNYKSDSDENVVDFTANIHLSGLRTSLKLVKTIFGEINERVVTFCFDNSGSMYRYFHHFREHLLEALFKMLLSKNGQKFNIILFNSSVHQFASKHVDCVQENIIDVIKWMNKPSYESKTNMLAAIIKSFEDYPEAVYLVTDGFINKDRATLLSNLPHISKGRPIKCIMITSKIPPDDVALDFLEDMVSITNGTLSVVLIRDLGAVEVVMPIVYSARPVGTRRSKFSPFSDEEIDFAAMKKYFVRCKDCLRKPPENKTLECDPMENLPLIAPFISKDPISGKRCPFYHPFYHWYWPQFWESSGPSPTLLWAKNDPQYHSMWKDFSVSRAFVCDQKYLDKYNNAIYSVAAGIILINRKVLAFNYKDENKLYLGKVINQLTPNHFIVKFDVYEEFDDAQKTNLNEIIDFEEQKRHSIKINDFVIIPVDKTDGPYEIAVVLEGNETRSGINLIPVRDSKLKVNTLESNSEKVIPFNQAIFISSSLKENIIQHKAMLDSVNKRKTISENELSSSKKQLSEIQNLNKFVSNDTNSDTLDNFPPSVAIIESNPRYHCSLEQNPCNICCGYYYFKPKNVGRLPSPSDNGKAKTLEEIDEEIQKNKTHSITETKTVDDKEKSTEKEDIVHVSSDVEDDKFEDVKYSEIQIDDTTYNFDSDDYDISYDKSSKKNTFTETDLNYCILRILNKSQKNNNCVNDKKQWKYWGKKPIPDIIDPPTTEPYQEPPNWGGCPMPKAVLNPVEWPSTTFQTVNPHVITDYSPKKMQQIFHHESHKPTSRPKRDMSVGTNNYLSPEELCQIRYESKFKYMQGGYPKLEIKYPNKDSIKPILASWSTLNPRGNKKDTKQCLRSIEKSRINAQIQRDENNYLNFIRHKMQISEDLCIKYKTIISVIRLYEKTGRILSKKTRAPKIKKITEEGKRLIDAEILNDVSITLQKLQSKLSKDLNIEVCPTTVNNSITDLNYTFKRVQMIPLHRNTENNIEKRFHYCSTYLTCNDEKVIFLDEFGVSCSSRQKYGRSLRNTVNFVNFSVKRRMLNKISEIKINKNVLTNHN